MRSLDESIKFYSEAFGFSLHNRVTRTDPWLASVVGAMVVRMHFAHMRLANGNHLELIEYETPAPVGTLRAVLPWGLGVQHVCLDVEGNINDRLETALNAGAKLWSRAVETIPDGPNVGARCVYLRGPSEELIELYEAAR